MPATGGVKVRVALCPAVSPFMKAAIIVEPPAEEAPVPAKSQKLKKFEAIGRLINKLELALIEVGTILTHPDTVTVLPTRIHLDVPPGETADVTLELAVNTGV